MHKPVIWWGMVIFSHGDRCEICQLFSVTAVAYRRGRGWGLWGFKSPYSKFRRPSKIMPNSTRLWKLLKIAEFRTPTLQDVLKKGSKILKLLPVRSCFTLAMTYRLVVIITSLKVPKMKKILLNELKVLLPNYNCLQNPWLGGYRPQIPVLPVLNWVCWNPPPRTKFLGTPLSVIFLFVYCRTFGMPGAQPPLSYTSVMNDRLSNSKSWFID